MYFSLTYRFFSLVIADTKAQVINKACKAIKKFREQSPGGKFILLVDEADAMFRTYDRHQVFEQALEQLMDLGPAMVSRTNMCIFFYLVICGQFVLFFSSIFLSYIPDMHDVCYKRAIDDGACSK